jgi:hypothetical protein
MDELIDHIQHAIFSPVMSAVFDKVTGPDVIWIFRAKAQT